ncbi:MAG: hypothetical protein KBC12_01590 [Candidatus Pacebacteria bacterium]|nr:hypothetical protein [Candidatus Paceibacterota bacterium]
MKKPFLFALCAAVYIVFIVSAINYVGSLPVFQGVEGQDNLLMPMTMLALLVLSVALMGFLFLSQPILLYIEGDKKGAVNFFLKTLGSFACLVLVFLGVMFLL